MHSSAHAPRSHARFAPTRWSLIASATSGAADTAARNRAWGELARQYWFPAYAFFRRQGQSPESAEDLTQDFFAHLIEKSVLAHLDRARGRFRSFLLAALKNFLLHDLERLSARKRGGGLRQIALDAQSAEARYALEPADHRLTPEKIFEQRWAWSLLEHVLERLRARYESQGQADLFAALRPALQQRPAPGEYAAVARQFGLTEGAVVVAAHRLRRRYRELLRDEIAQTVASPDLVDEEIQYLLGCL